MKDTYVLHYSEVALKGKNRPEFVRVLRHNVRRALAPLGEIDIESKDGRLIVSLEAAHEDVAGRLSKVFGIAWFARTSVVQEDYEQIRASVLDSARRVSGGSFMIDATRSDKSFVLNSMELRRALGSEVERETGMGVDLTNPDQTIYVAVLHGRALVYAEKQRGPGGLPVGTAGRSIHLFSGGIDSPVAAWLLMKRGCRPVFLHFYLAPTPEYALQSKVMELVKVLSAYSGRSTLLLIPFAEYQLATSDVPGDLEPSLFRRFMRMTAEALAPRFGAAAISTGDSLSQAASQTLWNIRSFDDGSSLPVLRPLLSYDKEEVIDLARRIGSYELSIQEYKDCCAMITRHPKTRTRSDTLAKYAVGLDFEALLTRSVEAGTAATFNPATGNTKVSSLASALTERKWTPAVAELPARGPSGAETPQAETKL